MTPNASISSPHTHRPQEAFPLTPQGLATGSFQLPTTTATTSSYSSFAPFPTTVNVLAAHGKSVTDQNSLRSEALPLAAGQEKDSGQKAGNETMDVDVGGGEGEYIDVFRS